MTKDCRYCDNSYTSGMAFVGTIPCDKCEYEVLWYLFLGLLTGLLLRYFAQSLLILERI
jgi:hypothetical protein